MVAWVSGKCKFHLPSGVAARGSGARQQRQRRRRAAAATAARPRRAGGRGGGDSAVAEPDRAARGRRQ
jgi:hypothetical protein